MKKITEGKATLVIPEKIEISRKAEAFYNPNMELNRDFSNLITSVIKKRENILDLLSATGVRGIRYFLEVDGIENVYFIEKNPDAYKYLEKNIQINKVNGKSFLGDCRKFCLEFSENNVLFQLIDIDPFGSPIHFTYFGGLVVDRRLSYMFVTATDLGALVSKSIKATIRKYFTINDRLNPFREDLALRILISFIARELLKLELGIKPIAYHYEKHFLRVYLEVSRKYVNSTIKNLGYYIFFSDNSYLTIPLENNISINTIEKNSKIIGPIWIGNIIDIETLNKINFEKFEYLKYFKHIKKYIEIEKQEFKVLNNQNFNLSISIRYLMKIIKKEKFPKIDEIIKKFNDHGIFSSRSALYNLEGIRFIASIEEIKKIL